MAKKIPHDFILEIIDKANIEQLIGERITCRKRGHEYTACCPFHQEKTASFTISPAKQFYHCFGCGAHGNVIDFLMQHDRLSFPEAVEHLAGQMGMRIPQSAQENQHLAPLRELTERAAQFFEQQLHTHRAAITYLKKRGLTGKTAKYFRLGVAPSGWQTLTDKLNTNRHAPKLLIDAGLTIAGDKRPYDRFRDRIMFPIRNERGQVIAFGARALCDEQNPKYLNSPETPLFHKSYTLYGLYEARQTRADESIVVEGYMDVIALHQHGIPGAMACLGTALTVDHFKKLIRFSKRITFCFDGDKAGHRASWRTLTTILPLMRGDLCVRFLRLPNTHDPDSYIRDHGSAAFKNLLDEAPSLTTYLFQTLAEQHPLTQTDQRAQFAEQAITLVRTVQNDLFQGVLQEEISRLSQIPSTHIERAINQSAAPSNAPQPADTQNDVTNDTTAIIQQIAWLIHTPELGAQPLFMPADLPDDAHRLLQYLYEWQQKNPTATQGQLLSLVNNTPLTTTIYQALAAIEELLAPQPAAAWQALNQQRQKQQADLQIQQLLNAARQGTLSDTERKQLQQLIARKQQIQTPAG